MNTSSKQQHPYTFSPCKHADCLVKALPEIQMEIDMKKIQQWTQSHEAWKTILVVGSTEEWIDDRSRALCDKLGVALSNFGRYRLIGGGTTGVPRRVGIGFAQDYPQHVLRVLPKEHQFDLVPAFGTTMILGKDMADRRQLIANNCDLMIVIAGGPGTAHEVEVAHEAGVPILMVESTGGVAGGKVPVKNRKAILERAYNLGFNSKNEFTADPKADLIDAVAMLIASCKICCRLADKPDHY